jgi:hypothetical protein
MAIDSDYEAEYDAYYDSLEDEEPYSESESDEDDIDYDDPFFQGPPRSVNRWTSIKIMDAILEVSSEGKVRPYNIDMLLGQPLATEGIHLKGTPYRTYTVEIEKGVFKQFYMHELVYHAFLGQPPKGYEVRHIPEHTDKPRKTYSNRLGCLTIAPSGISPMFVGDIKVSAVKSTRDVGVQEAQAAASSG